MRLIDADALKVKVEIGAEIAKLKFDGDMAVVAEAVKECIGEVLDNAPTIEAEPVRHGKWLPHITMRELETCSECGKSVRKRTYGVDHGQKWVATVTYPYCPECGAKMEDADD